MPQATNFEPNNNRLQKNDTGDFVTVSRHQKHEKKASHYLKGRGSVCEQQLTAQQPKKGVHWNFQELVATNDYKKESNCFFNVF
jgi:hypothetical protein